MTFANYSNINKTFTIETFTENYKIEAKRTRLEDAKDGYRIAHPNNVMLLKKTDYQMTK